MHRPEILAPAGSMEALTAAVRCGADAVYVGGTMYSARSSAANFDLVQLREASNFCKLHGAKLYLAVNTLLTDFEMQDFQRYIQKAGPLVDACIVQDLGVLHTIRHVIPEMPLHASTQMSIHTPAGARQAYALGCSRVVAAREMSGTELAALCREMPEVEVFVHGALCMSVSGQCNFSALVGGRSANRGQCAQACRLPWRTPAGVNPAALSLKDLSLVAHVEELCRMGVDSFKIEGRMKRPEYVAAAVTALRQALAGEQPDMERLQAVFSRNGFTDGYFTGKRKEMFGFRRKEDVLAGKAVLGELAALYEKPITAAVLDFSLQLRADSPSLLTVSDDSGLTVVTKGEVPETARKQPLSADMLRRSMQKLGGTVYACGEVRVDNPDGLILSAAQCNALRRSAVEQMDSLRITRNTPVYTVSEYVPGMGTGQIVTGDPYRLHVRTAGQLAAALTTGAVVCVPPHLAANCTPSESVYVEAPRILHEETYTRQLQKLRDRGFVHLICHNLSDIVIGKELGFVLHGGYGLNITNCFTIQELKDMGVCDVTGSAELHMDTLDRMADVGILPVGAVVYGRLPMMLFRVCPIRAQDGCRKHDCFLTDRTGRQFPLLCSGDYQELVNCNVLWLERNAVKGLHYQELYFTDEPPARLPEVLNAYRNGGMPPVNRTSGLYKKGGLR